MLTWVDGKRHMRTVEPLERVSIKSDIDGLVTVSDGAGNQYHLLPISASEDMVCFTAGGVGGIQTVTLNDVSGSEVDRLQFKLQAQTHIDHGKSEFGHFLTQLHFTMRRCSDTGMTTIIFRDRIYRFFVCWLRDHVHTLKGMRYFESDLKTGVEIYRDTQRDDGMIWDNIDHRPHGKPTSWDARFDYDGFIGSEEELEFKRIPVENDVEYLFVEGIYNTWKATGDDAWMSEMLAAAEKALDYSRTSPYRWSEKYGLLKRGFTIDTWDFQSEEDTARAGGDIMVVRTDKTEFGIMHGDNTGYINACRQLAEMLRYLGKEDMADNYDQLGAKIWSRLVELSWNGRFFTHHIPESEGLIREFDVDQDTQLSLSNAYATNRQLPLEMSKSIVHQYMRLKDELPEGSPGEWYTIYPPFMKGFDKDAPVWDYMNGGVTPIVAGELARGAFFCGEERYGVDILRRVARLADETSGYLHCCYRGAGEPELNRTYDPIDLEPYGNCSEIVPGWHSEAPSEYHQLPSGALELLGLPFSVSKQCVRMCSSGYTELFIPISKRATSMYLLHTGGHGDSGRLTIHYADGTAHEVSILEGKDFLHWWAPDEPKVFRGKQTLAIAWEGCNHLVRRVSISVKGIDNPYPDKLISGISFKASQVDGHYWHIAGLTLSDSPVYIEQRKISFGIPDNWGAAAVVYALMEGLAGIEDCPGSVSFSSATVSPRWLAADKNDCSACSAYPASGGYVAYDYKLNNDYIEMTFTGSGKNCDLRLMLPDESSGSHRSVQAVQVDGRDICWHVLDVGESRYVNVALPISGVHTVKVWLSR